MKKTKAILFSNSTQSQNICPPILIDSNSRGNLDPGKIFKIELVEQNDSVRLLGLWIDPLLTFRICLEYIVTSIPWYESILDELVNFCKRR